jgi:hypothetical protein
MYCTPLSCSVTCCNTCYHTVFQITLIHTRLVDTFFANAFLLSSKRTAAIPVLGQASQGISAGLGGLSTALGGAGTAARNTIRGLGITGLDAGFGCGVGLGYGFGAGLMLKPSAAQQLLTLGSNIAGEWGHWQLGWFACSCGHGGSWLKWYSCKWWWDAAAQRLQRSRKYLMCYVYK